VLTVTKTLVIALLGAALIGVCIGWLMRRIIAIQRTRQLLQQHDSRLQLQDAEITALKADEKKQEEELVKSRAMISSYDKAAKESVKQASEFSAALKRKDQRVTELEAQVLASEEQHMRVQRDFAKLRLTKTREVQQLRQQLAERVADAGGVEIHLEGESDENLPVLNKKAPPNDVLQNRSGLAIEQADATENGSSQELFDISNETLDTDEDIFDMTSDFDFEAAESMLNKKEKPLET